MVSTRLIMVGNTHLANCLIMVFAHSSKTPLALALAQELWGVGSGGNWSAEGSLVGRCSSAFGFFNQRPSAFENGEINHTWTWWTLWETWRNTCDAKKEHILCDNVWHFRSMPTLFLRGHLLASVTDGQVNSPQHSVISGEASNRRDDVGLW